MVRSTDVVHRGSVVARGVVYVGDGGRAEVMAHWTRADRVYRVDSGYLVVWAKPRRVLCERVRGVVLAHRKDRLESRPGDGHADVGWPAAVRYTWHGRGHLTQLGGEGAPEIDPSAWVSLEGLDVMVLEPVVSIAGAARRAEAASRPAKDAVAAAADDPRDILPDVPPESGAAKDVVEALRDANQPRDSSRKGLHAAHGSGGITVAGRSLISQALRSVARLARALAPGNTHTTPHSGTGHGATAVSTPTASRTTRVSPWRRLRAWASRTFWRSQLARALGRKHAEHLHELMKLFEQGKLDEALHNAIPLSASTDPSGPIEYAMLPPAARQSLRLSFEGASQGTTTPLSAVVGVFDMLRERYQRAFEQLRDRGEVDKAAFVLAELLNDASAAVTYLEREGRIETAAKLAESRALPMVTVVRLWVRAAEEHGDYSRAFQLARKHRLFEPLLGQQLSPQQEVVVRRAWAEAEAAAGNHERAAVALLPCEATRFEARPHLEQAVSLGGESGARALAMLIQHLPLTGGDAEVHGEAAPLEPTDALEAAQALVVDRLSGPHLNASTFAVAFAQQLTQGVASAAAQAESRRLVPFLAQHREQIGPRIADRLRDQLIQRAGDAALRADTKRIEAMPSDAPTSTILDANIAPGDEGVVRQARVLPNGQLLLALGDAGVRLTRADGTVLHSFDAPCDALVVSELGTRAIAVRNTRGFQTLTKLDLVQRREQRWWEARLTSYASHFDGERWAVATANELFLIDACAEGWESFFRVPIDANEGAVTGITVVGSTLSAHLGTAEMIRYELSSARCLERSAVQPDIVALAPVQVAQTLDGWLECTRSASPCVGCGRALDGAQRWSNRCSVCAYGDSAAPAPDSAYIMKLPPDHTALAFVRRGDVSAAIASHDGGISLLVTDKPSGTSTLTVNVPDMRVGLSLQIDGPFVSLVGATGRVVVVHAPTQMLAARLSVRL